jgi:hypothetical protein
MFTVGFLKEAAKTKAKPAPKRPDPNSRPQLLYPAVPENFDGWPNKMGAASPPILKTPLPSLPKHPQALVSPVGRQSRLPMPKMAAAKPKLKRGPLWGKLTIYEPQPLYRKKPESQMITEPLGASMPCQSTGGGIAGYYGSN